MWAHHMKSLSHCHTLHAHHSFGMIMTQIIQDHCHCHFVYLDGEYCPIVSRWSPSKAPGVPHWYATKECGPKMRGFLCKDEVSLHAILLYTWLPISFHL